MTGKKFGEFGTAAAMNDVLRQLIVTVVDKVRPKYRYGIVEQIDYDNRICYVVLNGDSDATKVNVGHISPVAAGQQVKVEGLPGDLLITSVYDDNNVAGVRFSKSAEGSGLPIGVNYVNVTQSSWNHTTSSQWLDVVWNVNNLVGYQDDGLIFDTDPSTADGMSFVTPQSGLVLAYAAMTWPDNATGDRGLRWVYNDESNRILNSTSRPASGGVNSDPHKRNVFWMGYLPKGQPIKVQAYQSSGGALAPLPQSPDDEFVARFALVQGFSL